jgi:hypothetical protein
MALPHRLRAPWPSEPCTISRRPPNVSAAGCQSLRPPRTLARERHWLVSLQLLLPVGRLASLPRLHAVPTPSIWALTEAWLRPRHSRWPWQLPDVAPTGDRAAGQPARARWAVCSCSAPPHPFRLSMAHTLASTGSAMRPPQRFRLVARTRGPSWARPRVEGSPPPVSPLPARAAAEAASPWPPASR